MKKISLSLALVFSFSILSLNAQGTLSGIRGQVIDNNSNTELASVHIQLALINSTQMLVERTTISDSEGNFTFSDLEAGTYRLMIRHLGYVQQSLDVILKKGKILPVKFSLDPSKLELGEVSVASLRYSRSEREVALPLQVISREKITQLSGMSLSDVVSKEPGIALYRDGAWATSMSVRGLGENRLVSMVDGNRIESATDLAGGLSMIDVNELERIEVVKGSASSVYGTGALGGVINMITRKGHYQEKAGIHGETNAYYEAVNKMIGTHVALESGGRKWYLRASGGYRNADDMKTPEGILDNSQFTDYNYNLSFGLKPFKNHELNLDFQDFTASDVGIPGGAPLAPSATASYKSAERRMFAGKYTIHRSGKTLQDIRLKLFNQYIYRDVKMIPNTPSVTNGNKRITANLVTPRGAHFTNGVSIETDWKLAEKHTLLFGVDYWQRKVETSREKYITQEILDDFQMVLQTLEIIKGEKPIPDSRFSTVGLFIQDEIKLLDDKLDVQLGARLDGIHVYNQEARDPFSLSINGVAKDPVPGQRTVFAEQTKMSLSWSLNAGSIYHINEDTDLTLNFGRSFRSPSLEERFKYIDLGSKVRLGDPDLKPEKGWFGDIGYKIWSDKLTGQINGFAHYLRDMIVEQPGEFIYNESDTVPALINSNVDQALLFGFEARSEYLLYKSLVLSAQASYVRGVDLLNEGNLPLIAPLSAGVGFRYQLVGVFNLQWNTSYVAAQNKIANGETASEQYWISDFALYSVARHIGPASFQLFLGVDNVFNADYVNHLATNRGMVRAEPGRNVFVKLAMTF